MPFRFSLPGLGAPRSPVDLAVIRIVVFALLAALCVQQHPVWMASLPKDLLDPPPLTGWLTSSPISPAPVYLAQSLAVCCALAAMVGLWYRWTAPLAVLASLYVLGVPQLWGKVDHYHNVVWFAAILAATPADHALALGRKVDPRPVSGRPFAFIAVLIGIIYFWPGLAKAHTGWAWIWSDNLAVLLHQKWEELPGFTPLVRLDRWPLALRLSALGVVAFELSFIWLIFVPRLRPLAIVGGLAFHAGSALVMGINFWPLWPCYVVFIRWRPVQRDDPIAAGRGVQSIGWALCFAAVLAYPLRLNSWPVAYYPTFAGLAHSMPRTTWDATDWRIASQMEGSRWTAILERATAHPDPAVRARTARGIAELRRAIGDSQVTGRGKLGGV